MILTRSPMRWLAGESVIGSGEVADGWLAGSGERSGQLVTLESGEDVNYDTVDDENDSFGDDDS
jgi:hypothetical protein